MDSGDVTEWFDAYLEAFAACCRGAQDAATLLAYYGVPLLVSTDAGFFALTSDEQVVATLRQQVDGMRAAGYQQTEIVASDITVLNATSALYQGKLSRQRSDGSEISLLIATYLVTDGPAGRRFSLLAVHSS